MFRKKDRGELALIAGVFLLLFYGSFMVNVTFIHYWYEEVRLDLQYVPGKLFSLSPSNDAMTYRNSAEIQRANAIRFLQWSLRNANHNLHPMCDDRSGTNQGRNESTNCRSIIEVEDRKL